jgi:outer membrane lipoprotein-sorting protein
MMSLVQKARTALAAALFLAVGAGAAQAITPEQGAALNEISAKLRSISTLNGEFIQFNPSGDKVEGKFYIARPGKVHFEYAKPSTISVVADGKSVLVHDKKLRTYDIWPLSQTPLRLLLDSNLDLATSDKVTGVGVASDLVEVVLVDKTKFGGGTLTLVFDKVSTELRQWTIKDEQGLETTVALYNVEIGNQLASDLFKIDYAAATNAAREKRRD